MCLGTGMDFARLCGCRGEFWVWSSTWEGGKVHVMLYLVDEALHVSDFQDNAAAAHSASARACMVASAALSVWILELVTCLAMLSKGEADCGCGDNVAMFLRLCVYEVLNMLHAGCG